MNYYNEWDAKTAAWLRELIRDGLIPKGEVDERSITDVQPGDLREFTQCHFFAGIGGWPYALSFAGWPEDREVWTGSCPCQPLSCAGLAKGHADERHLWPAFYELIAKCKPAAVFGEQVASKDGREWLAGIRADLEGAGYAVGGADLCAAGVSSPHIRQRLFWVADAECDGGRSDEQEWGPESRTTDGCNSENMRLADTNGGQSGDGVLQPGGGQLQQPADAAGDGWVGDSSGKGLEVGGRGSQECSTPETPCPTTQLPSAGFWSDAIWIQTRDPRTGKTVMRRASPEPEVFPLVDGLPYRLGPRRSSRAALLKGSGNAIVPQVAAEFIKAYLESCLT